LNFLHLGVVLGGVCGLRIAEVLGLRARDVNASARTISIRQTVEPHYDRTAEKGQRVVLRFKEPKSERSRRTIDDVPAEVFEALDFHLSNVRADRPIGDALLITRPDGSTWSPDGFGKRYVKAARSLGLGGSFHSLRHTCCTLLLEDGIDLATVSRILGHEKASFTGDRYAHATARSKRRASASMARMFGAG
jgi:integrase